MVMDDELHISISPPQAWNVGPITPEGSPPPPAQPTRESWAVLCPPGNLDVRYKTGRKQATLMLYSTIPDGETHFVGMLTPEQISHVYRRLHALGALPFEEKP